MAEDGLDASLPDKDLGRAARRRDACDCSTRNPIIKYEAVGGREAKKGRPESRRRAPWEAIENNTEGTVWAHSGDGWTMTTRRSPADHSCSASTIPKQESMGLSNQSTNCRRGGRARRSGRRTSHAIIYRRWRSPLMVISRLRALRAACEGAIAHDIGAISAHAAVGRGIREGSTLVPEVRS